MRTIITLFFSSLFVSLILTPIVRELSLKLNLVDLPSGRKVHTTAISRVGGVAVFFAFLACISLSYFSQNNITRELFTDISFFYLLAGGGLIFLMGLIDDILNLNAKIKLLAQIGVATLAYYGGMRITGVTFPFVEYLSTGILSFPLTLFWFLIIINAVNLIDGLDGLAAGVSLLVCLILTLSGCLAKEFVVAAAFACLSGAILGFLKYNFNPATIFMGDSGSYFIGYMIASLSLLGSIKGHTAATLFVTLLALGVPLADTVIATLRRYMLGQKIFSPDKAHFHHQLLKQGFSHKNAVLLLYLVTFSLCMAAVLVVYLNDQKSAIVLLVIALSVIFGIRKLGYFNHVDFENFVRWSSDIQDGIGLTHGRRQFLAHQLAIHEAKDMDEFKYRIEKALKMIDVDYLKLELGGRGCNFRKFEDYIWKIPDAEPDVDSTEEFNRRLFITFPIIYKDHNFGRLTTSREEFGSSSESAIVLRRIEILRRTIGRTLHDKKDITSYNIFDRRTEDPDRRVDMDKRGIDRRKGDRRVYNRRSEDKNS